MMFGKNLKKLRKSVGLTQTQLAEEFNKIIKEEYLNIELYSINIITNIETGRANITAEDLIMYSKYFDVTPNQIMDFPSEIKVIDLQEKYDLTDKQIRDIIGYINVVKACK